MIALVAVSLPSAVSAKCAAPGAFLVPGSGEVPQNPALHLFVPSWMEQAPVLTARSGDHVLASKMTIVGSSPAFRVYRIEIETGDSSSIDVSFERWSNEVHGTYHVDARYAGAPRSAVQIEEITEKSYQWTCSYEETRRLGVDTRAPLYRVEFAASEEEFRSGVRRSLHLPHRTSEVAFRWEDSEVPESPLLVLGHVDCLGSTLEWKGPIWAAIVAMYPDGTETPLGAPQRIDPPSSSKGKGPTFE